MSKFKHTLVQLRQEAEANQFACALLMPRELFINEIEANSDMHEDELINHLCKRFQVPLFAVVMRFQMLTNNYKVS